jgi:hypothetical protein
VRSATERAIERDGSRRDRAIDEGKSSPLLRRSGFVLAVTLAPAGDRRWRAVRPGCPLLPAERVAAHFHPVAGEPGVWAVRETVGVPTHLRGLAKWLARKRPYALRGN